MATVTMTRWRDYTQPRTFNGFEIESGIDIPQAVRRPTGFGREAFYPFGKMEVGDSFLATLPFTLSNGRKVRTAPNLLKCLLTAARSHGQKYNAKFTARTVPEGVRVWRTA